MGQNRTACPPGAALTRPSPHAPPRCVLLSCQPCRKWGSTCWSSAGCDCLLFLISCRASNASATSPLETPGFGSGVHAFQIRLDVNSFLVFGKGRARADSAFAVGWAGIESRPHTDKVTLFGKLCHCSGLQFSYLETEEIVRCSCDSLVSLGIVLTGVLGGMAGSVPDPAGKQATRVPGVHRLWGQHAVVCEVRSGITSTKQCPYLHYRRLSC